MQKTVPEQPSVALPVSLEYELRQYLAKSVLPIDIHGYSAGEGQPVDDLLLYPQFGMHVQGDDVRSIFHIHNPSIAPHNCNRIGHHSGSYYHSLSESRVVRVR